ncbi:MAG: DNA polymerase III subunit gamma/tau [Muribaculaceae bacterium]|nr:DNA polymerase III subunit gamma/tau [Roseburia sp.]MCM1430853.1 DNA polymerase III subunit gamma/tau [Muribaculaceae bacterium]MCM1492832.1 DNA polymerase III subunit gamma/tau [Muribaculaceae bacterium]
MSYTALYRKFRPQEFEDVRGQEHIVTTLKNQIKADRIGHAYLFCGTRGTGKTTVAKIFARAVNCENPADGSPCGSCAACKSIAAGTSMNVIEIDAASNNGVDNIRQIREEVSYRPTEGRYKVYIIDEVHMLSAGAFNALLKTLEEPPAYVIFILATTEAHKIPITILSRCQRYDFHRISMDTITARLAELMEEEKVEAEEKALRYVAKVGDGSMRDALSLLDQCIAFHLGETLTYENVLEVLGAVDTEVFSRLLRQILGKDIVGAIGTVDALVNEGRELGQLVNDFTWYMRNLLLIQSSDEMEETLDMSKDNLAALKEEAAMIEPEPLMRYIRIFSELGNQVKYAAQKRILLEIAIIKLCRPQMERDYSALVDRLDSLEKRLESGAFVSAPQQAGAPVAKQEKPPLPKAIPEDIALAIKNWKAILSEAGGIARQYLNRAVPSLGVNGGLLLVFDDPTAYAYLNEDRAGSMSAFGRLVSERIGKEVGLTLRLNDSGRTAKETVPDLREMITMDIVEENFDD